MRHRIPFLAVLAGLLVALLFPTPSAAKQKQPSKVPIILDTDIGTGIDGAFALALALASPEVELCGVTTVGGFAKERAWLVCRFLTQVDRRKIPVAAGVDPKLGGRDLDGQIQYRRHPAAIFNRTSKPLKESAVEFLYRQLKARPGELTLVATGPLTNIAHLLQEHPDCVPWIKRIIISGGIFDKTFPKRQPNLYRDRAAAQRIFALGVPLVVVPAETTSKLALQEPLRQQLFAACTALTFQVQNLYQLWDQATPELSAPIAVLLSFDERFCQTVGVRVQATADGELEVFKGKSKANAKLVTSLKSDEFLKWYVERVAAGKAVLPKPPPNPSKMMAADGMPNRVHAFEDYETDIEKRWWMSGKAETVNVPPEGGRRACRGVLTQDFDDLQGDMKTMYTAVIFNPVPGPPMGKQPRLRFRYWLKGTDTLRVQIYSLTRGFHRCLTLTGLPQAKWQLGTVDMTQVRRPDGSGGPLAENERIDDIQFYVDPRAELLIDDIVLYDAPVVGEKRPFPSRLLFSGLFDTGKQGKEWPGTFEIVDKQGSFWRAAKSVPRTPQGPHWIQLKFRGERPAGKATELFFRYRLTGADSVEVVLVNRTAKGQHRVTLKGLAKDRWAESLVNFSKDGRDANGKPSAPRLEDRLEELHFLLPQGAELLVDDVLLYAPGK